MLHSKWVGQRSKLFFSAVIASTHLCHVLVSKKFDAAWKAGPTSKPVIKKIFKIIESKAFLQPYDQYKSAQILIYRIVRSDLQPRKRVGNEDFRYHGTYRGCTLGATGGTTTLCTNSACRLCGILRTSFKTSLAGASAT